MRADQGRIRDILKETILALLNNGVEFTSELEVDGLLGVTIDKKDVFLVKISEVVASQRRHAGGDKESSDEDAGTGSSSKGRKKRRSPSPKNKGEKRQRVASPTQSIPSSSTSHKADNAKAEKAQVNIDLTSVKSEPVDTTVSDSNHSMGDMSDVGPSFDYNQQQPHITSIQAVAQTPDAESAQGTWSQHHQEFLVHCEETKPQNLSTGLFNRHGSWTHETQSTRTQSSDLSTDQSQVPCVLADVFSGLPVKSYKNYTPESLENALAAIESGEMTVGQASLAFGVPGRTLHNHKKKKQKIKS